MVVAHFDAEDAEDLHGNHSSLDGCLVSKSHRNFYFFFHFSVLLVVPKNNTTSNQSNESKHTILPGMWDGWADQPD